jgi:hypothetical protein
LRGRVPVATITSVIPNDDHTLLIELSNQHSIIYDLKPRLKTVRFMELNDLEKFKSVRVDHGNTLIWDNLCQLTIDEILDRIER